MSDAKQFSHRELLEGLVKDLEECEQPWYAKMAATNWWAWHILAFVAFACTLVSGALAGVLPEEAFKSYGRPLLVILPLISALAGGCISLFKLREKESLREAGRIEADDMIAVGKSMLASDAKDTDYQKHYHDLRERGLRATMTQHRSDVSLRTDESIGEATKTVVTQDRHSN